MPAAAGAELSGISIPISKALVVTVAPSSRIKVYAEDVQVTLSIQPQSRPELSDTSLEYIH